MIMRMRILIHSAGALLFTLLVLAMPAAASAQIGVFVSFGPPELPVYEQPVCPGEGYIWTPGYWAWDNDGDDYYWVPGTWVLAPEVGFLWTPGYWGWGGRGFIFNEGYWGPRVGFYGGINYGFGYFGHGYEGGRWEHDHFFYNREVNNVNVTVIHNVYNTRVENNYTRVTRVSYNGGNGGINERPTREEEAVAHERHISPVRNQVQHAQAARTNPELRASANHGKPPIAATPKPGAFHERGVVPAKEGGHYNPPPRSGNSAAGRTETSNAARPNPVHPKELPPIERHAAPNTGNPKVDQKYQQQQSKLTQRQEQDRQKLQQKQEQQHQQLTQKNAGDARKQQIEQQHQQQTQQLAQKHTQQQQKLQQKQQPPPRQNEAKSSNKKP
jgi:hypothetical protein